MKSSSQEIIINQFDLFSLAEQVLGVEAIITCNCISQLNTKEGNVFKLRNTNFTKKDNGINLQWINGIWR